MKFSQYFFENYPASNKWLQENAPDYVKICLNEYMQNSTIALDWYVARLKSTLKVAEDTQRINSEILAAYEKLINKKRWWKIWL